MEELLRLSAGVREALRVNGVAQGEGVAVLLVERDRVALPVTVAQRVGRDEGVAPLGDGLEQGVALGEPLAEGLMLLDPLEEGEVLDEPLGSAVTELEVVEVPVRV